MSNQLTLIKVGSSSCIDSDARTIRFGFMEQLAKSIAAEIERDGSQRFAIISSGAVAKGRIVAEHSNRLEKNHYA
ncbi:MAG TPA: hypothetical protein PK765_04200 [bacterium]|nr:hypothetical protein [bacterium]